MQYKLPEKYKGYSVWIPKNECNIYKKFVIPQTILSIEPILPVIKMKWDLETETHNYFANGILVHNSNARFCFSEGRMRVGGHYRWLKENSNNVYWQALKLHPEIIQFCQENSHFTLYGEVYGDIQSLKYGMKGKVDVVIFDIRNNENGEWIPPFIARELGKNLPWVPTLVKNYPFNLENVLALAEGNSLIPNAHHIREGIVCSPMSEKYHADIGRVKLKVVSNAYLSGKSK